MTRESASDEVAKASRDGTLVLIRPVTTSTDGRWVANTRWMPAARADGMGKSAAGTDAIRAGAALLIAALTMAALIGPGAAMAVLAAQAGVQLGFGWVAMRQIGGQSGDVLGAAQQLAEIAGWLVLAAVCAC